MESLWNPDEAAACGADPLALRVYGSRLLGAVPELVLHGGGNTSVKAVVPDRWGDPVEALLVKGSGFDLATIVAEGFTPLRRTELLRMLELEELEDEEMVLRLRLASLDPAAPAPSVEALLHAWIPARYVDHTHADAVVTLTNAPGGRERIRELYGRRVLWVPWTLPGFALARRIRELTRNLDWESVEGLVLEHHGVFTWHDDPRESYERMIRLVDAAEQALPAAAPPPAPAAPSPLELRAALRREASRHAGRPQLLRALEGPWERACAASASLQAALERGPLTPDHVLRLGWKPARVGAGQEPGEALEGFARESRERFARLGRPGLRELPPAPRWILGPEAGVLVLGPDRRSLDITADLVRRQLPAAALGEALGGWRPVDEAGLFDIEYWSLEQAKLRREGEAPPLAGRVALVTGAASGIGRACARLLLEQGAAVAGVDRDPRVEEAPGPVRGGWLGVVADLTDPGAAAAAVRAAVETWGGLDLLVSNAGAFPPGAPLEEVEPEAWRRTLALNLDSHFFVLRAAIPWLRLGIRPAVVAVGSRNVLAPGPGVLPYSAAKAGLHQLVRGLALELAPDGVRVNSVHPDKVFDTGAWDEATVAARARRYGLSPEEYRRGNLLRREVRSEDVARAVLWLLSDACPATTGAGLPVDGGDPRAI